MEVILIKDMENLGYANDIVTVKPGYANNYLIPSGLRKGRHRIRQEGSRRESPPARPQGRQDPRRRTGARRDHRQPAAHAGPEGRGGQALRYGYRHRPGRGTGCQRHRTRPQADRRRGHQDRRRVRSDRQTPQGGQGRHQILGYRRRIIRARRTATGCATIPATGSSPAP